MPLPLPRADNRARLPAVLALLLVVGLIAQLLLPATPDLPEAEPPLARRLAPQTIEPVVADSIIGERPLFTPTRRADGAAMAGEGIVASPLGGATVVGGVNVRGRARAILHAADGTIIRLPVGGVHEGWRLAAIGRDGALFHRQGERLAVPFGSAPVAPPPADETVSEEEDPEQ